jgi:predicted permease
MMGTLFRQDLPFAARMLVKNPGLTTVAVLSLGLAIGANTTVFTGINALFLSPIPGVEEPSRVYNLYTTENRLASGETRAPVSFLNYRDLGEQNNIFSDLAVFLPLPVSMVREGEPEQVNAQLVSANYFRVLSVSAIRGRTFVAEEDEGLGGHPVAVVSHSFWQNRLGGDPEVVGTTLTLNSHPFTVVGVSPPGFKGTISFFGAEQIWIPLSMRNEVVPANFLNFFESRRALAFSPFGRLNPGVSASRAELAMQAIAARLEEEYPEDNEGRGVALASLSDGALGINQRNTLVLGGTVIMAIVGLVLLIACVNLANLLLARGMARSREMGIRVALGASRGRILTQLVSESVVLAGLGGAVGLLIAYWGTGVIWALRPTFVTADTLDLSLDWRVLGFTVAISLVTGLLFGLLPSIQASRPDIHEALKVNVRGSSASLTRSRLRSALVIGEVSLALITLIGSGLFLRSMNEALEVDPGFEVENLFVFFMNLASRGYGPEEGRQFYAEAIERSEATPGVVSAAYSANFPIGGGFQRTVIPEEQEGDPERRGLLSQTNIVTPNYFETVGIPLVRGRVLSDLDREDVQLAAVINEATARRYWPDVDPLGRRFRFIDEPDQYREVVGIVGNTVVTQLGEAPQPVIYLPLAQNYNPFGALNVRTASDPDALMGPVMREVQALDSQLPLTFQSTVEDILGQSLWPRRLAAQLLAAFGLLALSLAAVGIYGIMSYSTSQRTREIGIRMAVGAGQGGVLRMVVRQGMMIAGAGVLLGLVLAAGFTRFLSGLLFGVSPLDPVTFGGIALLLLGVAFLATYVPARRATRIDPMVTFRTE